MTVSRSDAGALAKLSLFALASGLVAVPAAAEDAGAVAEAQAPADAQGTDMTEPLIVVTAGSLRGMVLGGIPAELDLGEEDIAAYGVSSIDELLESISPQTGSARGRGGGGRPIILLNGQRISGFREIHDLPPEAIERVQVFPEELAVRYGYRPDQRVVNVILRENFASFTGEIEHGESTAGGFGASGVEATLTRIGRNSRLNVNVEYEREGALLESERGIVQPQVDGLGLVDYGDFRTLTGDSDTFRVNANYSRQLTETLSATLSAEYTHDDRVSLLGLPGVALTVPSSSPFARDAGDETIFRYLPAAGGTLERFTAGRNAEAGLTLNGQLGVYHWSFTGNFVRTVSETLTERASGLDTLQPRIDAGDPAIDPFAPDLGNGLGFTRDRSRSVSQDVDATFNIAGALLDLPAGPLTANATAGYEWRAIDSRAERSGVVSLADLGRSRGFGRLSLDIPIASRREGVLSAIGDLSLNANIGYSELSDFGVLIEYGYGLSWEPVEGLSFLVSVIGEEAAPSVQQLGDAIVVTPNVSVFDFATGTSVFVDRTTGGNPALLAEDRRDFKLGVNYAPGGSRDIRFVAEYIRNRSDNVASSFPLLTPEIEAAFPDRVTRDAFGNLFAIDARPVNFAEVRGERIRYGVNLSGRLGGDEGERRGAGRGHGQGAGRGGGAGHGAGQHGGGHSAGRHGGGEGGGRRGGGPIAFMRRGGGRWQLSAYHTWRLDETVLIRPGVPELDLLDGSVTGGSSPLSRHSAELEGGVFLAGIGVRASAEYTGSSQIDGRGLPGSTDLFFDDLFTMNARLFFSFDSRPGLVEDIPFLAGSRLALRIDNLFGGVRRVTDQNGDVPLSYQPGYLDPRGRYVELSFRKRF